MKETMASLVAGAALLAQGNPEAIPAQVDWIVKIGFPAAFAWAFWFIVKDVRGELKEIRQHLGMKPKKKESDGE